MREYISQKKKNQAFFNEKSIFFAIIKLREIKQGTFINKPF